MAITNELQRCFKRYICSLSGNYKVIFSDGVDREYGWSAPFQHLHQREAVHSLWDCPKMRAFLATS